jgi:hypothetical protein
MLPSIVIKDRMGRRWLTGSFSWSAATERLMDAIVVVIDSELFQLALQVDGVPNEHVIKKLSSNCPDQSFDERIGHGDVRHRFDLRDLEYAQVGRPTVRARRVLGARSTAMRRRAPALALFGWPVSATITAQRIPCLRFLWGVV